MSTSANRWLLCKPVHYNVTYKINPWMDPHRRPESERAMAQWLRLHDALSRLKVSIELVDQTPGQPDMVFTANAGLVKGRKFVLAKFKYKERQGEEAGFRKWFEENGYEVLVPLRGSFEGEGDALFDGPDLLFCGHGFRTDRGVCDELGGLLSIKTVVPCELIDPRFYHLDTCFAPIKGGKALIFPDAFTKDSLDAMGRAIELLPIPLDEALRFACNAVVLEGDVVLPSGCPATEAKLQALGYRTHSVELDEYLKAGGAAKCLSLKL